MSILCIDTSSQKHQVVLMYEAGIVSRLCQEPRAKVNQLSSLIDQCLEEAQLTMSQVEHMAIVLGPGSFTGLRMGCAYMQGIALACQKPVVGISNLALIAKSAQQSLKTEAIYVALTVGKLGYYVGVLEGDAMVYEQFTQTLSPPSKTIFKVGDVEGFRLIEKSPESFVSLAQEQIKAQRFLHIDAITPNYLFQPEYRKVGDLHG